VLLSLGIVIFVTALLGVVTSNPRSGLALNHIWISIWLIGNGEKNQFMARFLSGFGF